MFSVILDNGHGSNTIGKRSPWIDFKLESNKTETSVENGRFKEYLFNRRVVKELISKLNKMGYAVLNLVPETKDISLKERVKRVNKHCAKYGNGNCILVSIHVNAAGDKDKWLNARGWSIWTTKGQNNSDKLADCVYESAKEYILKDKAYTAKTPIRTDFTTDGDSDCESNFYILKNSNCPSVLIENMFQDNKEDVKYLETKNGFNRIIETIANGIDNYYKKYKRKK